jgi:MFS family permease
MFGMGSALIWYPAITVPGQWFARRRALAMAIAGSSSGLGGTVWPIALDRLIKSIGKQVTSLSSQVHVCPDSAGFPWAIRTTAFISLFLLVIANLLIRTRLPRKKPTPLSAVKEPLRERSFVLLQFCVAGVFWGYVRLLYLN